MRPPLLIGTLLLDVVGTIWILQGLNVLKGSPMTGDPFWAWAGAGVLAFSGVIVAFNVLRAARK